MDILAAVVERILKVTQPEKIILFGSASRGDMRADSDLDLLVVGPPGTHRRRLAQEIYQNLIGVGHPVDVVVVLPEDIEKYGATPGLILESALREGITVYERQTSSTP